MEKTKLSREQTGYLINQIHSQEAIYDPSNKEYKNGIKNLAAWTMIQTLFKAEFGIELTRE